VPTGNSPTPYSTSSTVLGAPGGEISPGDSPGPFYGVTPYRDDIYFSLWFPTLVALVTVIIQAWCIPNRRNVDLPR